MSIDHYDDEKWSTYDHDFCLEGRGTKNYISGDHVLRRFPPKSSFSFNYHQVADLVKLLYFANGGTIVSHTHVLRDTANDFGGGIIKSWSPFRMSTYTCSVHDEDFGSMEGAIEHIRGRHATFIKRPGRVGCSDRHGHIWYCFDCETKISYHRSFDSDGATWSHLKICHVDLLSCYDVS